MNNLLFYPSQLLSIGTLACMLLAAIAPGARANADEEDPETPPSVQAPSKPKKPKPAPTPLAPIPGVRLEQNVEFLPPLEGKPRKEKADLYFPENVTAGQKLPAVIIIHGGGFNDGDKAKRREINIGTNLARNGYVGMSINYKLRKTQGQVTWPRSVLDAKTSVQWLRGNAERLGIDPDRIGVIGGSAGGNLAAMLALTQPKDGFEPTEGPHANQSTKVNCAIDLYGAVNLMTYHDMKMFGGVSREEAPELYIKASPTTYVHKASPPLLLIHGDADDVVKLDQSEILAKKLLEVGAPHELVVVKDGPHTFHLEDHIDLRPKVIGFFDQHLKGMPAR
jgi:acetyl esterase/lipase